MEGTRDCAYCNKPFKVKGLGNHQKSCSNRQNQSGRNHDFHKDYRRQKGQSLYLKYKPQIPNSPTKLEDKLLEELMKEKQGASIQIRGLALLYLLMKYD